MKTRLVILPLFIAAALSVCSPLLAIEEEDENYPTIGKGTYAPKAAAAEPVAKKAEDFRVEFFLATLGGYDTNIYLENDDHVGSAFAQGVFGVSAKYVLADYADLKFNYDVTSLKYAKSSEPDILDNVLEIGLDADVGENLLWSVSYIADFVGYPHDKASEYMVNGLSTSLRQDISEKLYHKITYRYSHKHYPKWKTRNNQGFVRMGDRADTRSTLEHQLGFYLNDKTFLKADNTVYFNNSNEAYLDYYDYTALKTKVTAVYLVTDKVYTTLNIGYQYKSYRNRSVTDRTGDDQRDHLLIGGASLFYDITHSVAIGTTFDYRRNYSNEGAQQYTNYIFSGGIYYRF